jgi:hypothetical protein
MEGMSVYEKGEGGMEKQEKRTTTTRGGRMGVGERERGFTCSGSE